MDTGLASGGKLCGRPGRFTRAQLSARTKTAGLVLRHDRCTAQPLAMPGGDRKRFWRLCCGLVLAGGFACGAPEVEARSWEKRHGGKAETDNARELLVLVEVPSDVVAHDAGDRPAWVDWEGVQAAFEMRFPGRPISLPAVAMQGPNLSMIPGAVLAEFPGARPPPAELLPRSGTPVASPGVRVLPTWLAFGNALLWGAAIGYAIHEAATFDWSRYAAERFLERYSNGEFRAQCLNQPSSAVTTCVDEGAEKLRAAGLLNEAPGGEVTLGFTNDIGDEGTPFAPYRCASETQLSDLTERRQGLCATMLVFAREALFLDWVAIDGPFDERFEFNMIATISSTGEVAIDYAPMLGPLSDWRRKQRRAGRTARVAFATEDHTVVVVEEGGATTHQRVERHDIIPATGAGLFAQIFGAGAESGRPDFSQQELTLNGIRWVRTRTIEAFTGCAVDESVLEGFIQLHLTQVLEGKLTGALLGAFVIILSTLVDGYTVMIDPDRPYLGLTQLPGLAGQGTALELKAELARRWAEALALAQGALGNAYLGADYPLENEAEEDAILVMSIAASTLSDPKWQQAVGSAALDELKAVHDRFVDMLTEANAYLKKNASRLYRFAP